MRHHGLDASPKHIERNGILGKLVRIDQTTAGLVESVGRKAIVDIKLAGGIDSLGVTANQPLHFLLGRLGVGHCVSAGQRGKILAKTMSGDEAMKIIRGMEVAGVVIPTAHIRARSGQARTLSKWFQQRVLIQAEKQFVVVFKLCPEESLEQLNLRIFE